MTRRAEAVPAGERGQALAFLLLLLAALLAGALFVFDSGQLVAAKVRLIGAADAAAYSAATYEARSLNYQAYMNRAIVGNEVAIAQSVSLRSWSGYMNQFLRRASTVSTVVPPLGAALRSVSQGWSTVDRGLQQALPPLEAAASRWNVDVLARAAALAQLQAAPAAVDLAGRVAAANEPTARLSDAGSVFAASNARSWSAFTVGYRRTGNERARLRQVAMDSRDGFSTARGWTLGPSFLLSLSKRGGTDLIGYDAWRGMDTLSLRVRTLFGVDEQPLAWNAAENQRLRVLARGDHGGSYRDNPRASAAAMRGLAPRRGYAGLPEYRDVARAAGAGAQLRYELELREPGDAIATSDRVMNQPATVVPGEALRPVAPAYLQGSAYALAAARVYFMRPVGRADRRQELPSLFNAYWQARLAPVSTQQRLLAAASHGGAADPYAVLP